MIHVQARVQFCRRIQHSPQHVHRVRPLSRRPPEKLVFKRRSERMDARAGQSVQPVPRQPRKFPRVFAPRLKENLGAFRAVAAKVRRCFLHFPFSVKRRRRKPDFHVSVPPFIRRARYASHSRIRAECPFLFAPFCGIMFDTI